MTALNHFDPDTAIEATCTIDPFWAHGARLLLRRIADCVQLEGGEVADVRRHLWSDPDPFFPPGIGERERVGIVATARAKTRWPDVN